MSVNKELVKGSTSMLVLGVLEEKEMYGYQIIKELEQRSETVFSLKEGTLYPILMCWSRMAFWKHIGRIRAQRENAASIGLQKRGEKSWTDRKRNGRNMQEQ